MEERKKTFHQLTLQHGGQMQQAGVPRHQDLPRPLARVPKLQPRQAIALDADQWTRFSRPVAKWHICSCNIRSPVPLHHRSMSRSGKRVANLRDWICGVGGQLLEIQDAFVPIEEGEVKSETAICFLQGESVGNSNLPKQSKIIREPRTESKIAD